MPAGRKVVGRKARPTPLEKSTGTGTPRELPSSRNCTVPVGAPSPGDWMLSVAVKNTLWPKRDGLADVLSATFVPALLTVSPPAKVPVLPANVPSPLYEAVIR